MTLRKHINTKHRKEEYTSFDHMTDEKDMFQIEIVENETVYACNICDQGFEMSEEMKKHISETHKDIINYILTNVADKNEDDDKKNELMESYADKIYSIENAKDACQIDIVHGILVFVCNWCNKGFESMEILKEHFNEKH